MATTTHEQAGSDPQNRTAGPGIRGFELGPFATNSYVVTPSADVPGTPKGACWIIDPSFEPDDLIAHVRTAGLKPAAIVLTHAHVDHIAGVNGVLRAFPSTPILIHPAEEAWLSDPLLNLSAISGVPVTAPPPSRLVNHADTLTLGPDAWRVLHTPGHSPGGVTLVHDTSGSAIVGDALFSGSIGRTDFPGSDHATLVRSIREKLYTLPEATTVYPGHGPPTTIGRERRSNPFVRPSESGQ